MCLAETARLPPQMPDHLFLYGTLLPELAPAPLRAALAGCQSVGDGSVPGRLYDLGRYPGLVPDPLARGRVLGQVFRLPEQGDVLEALDAYEGFDPADPPGSLYLRLPQDAELAGGERLSCWVYIYNRDPGAATLIPDGDYSRWLQRRRD
jgi:gamma-glutamylcyclotransferase (GGCT)/AIG2-like uncharacterized protein YtfP